MKHVALAPCLALTLWPMSVQASDDAYASYNKLGGVRENTDSSHAFNSEAEARYFCVKDGVAWLSSTTGVVVSDDDKNYGRRPGVYVCKNDAIRQHEQHLQQQQQHR